MKKLSIAVVCFLGISCNHLSKEAKEMVGDYYISEVSEDEPLMELNADGTCLMRAIKPGVLEYTVPGRWNVLRDTLFVDNDTSCVRAEGDTSLIGKIEPHMAKAIIDFSGVTLTLRSGGADYIYMRRGRK